MSGNELNREENKETVNAFEADKSVNFAETENDMVVEAAETVKTDDFEESNKDESTLKTAMSETTKKLITGLIVGALAATLIFVGIYFGMLKNETLVTTKEGNITKEDLYQSLKDQSGKNQLKSMVYLKVLEGKYGYTKADADKAMKELQTQYGEQLESLIMQNGYSSLEEFKKSTNFKLNNLISKAARENTKITDDEINAYYAKLKPQIRASHILLETEEKANQILSRAKAGEDFAALAKENSVDTASATQGGDLGFFGQGQMVPEFETAAYKLKSGEISQIVKTEHGYHIIKLTDTKEKEPIENMKEEIKRVISESKNDDAAITKLLEKIIKEADVTVKDEFFKDILK
ncbi:MAG: PpiC-type peptidyl-prolyl cis-trans isomerase [Bacillales bacterium]|jgi:foldase protein PrsA|nr:PpiC-type peptidyl-prolyl cis-trans isomerase [Bacillales bacterium]